MSSLRGAVVFVTGANRGLGLAFAQEALRRGARKVYAGVRTPDDRATTPGLEQVRLDVTDTASIAAAAARCGDTTVLVNNAGIARVGGSLLEPALLDAARDLLETNYFGMIRVSQAFAPILARSGGGAIVNVLSDAAWLSRPMLAAYSASKSAAWSFTNALRLELRPRGTLVVALHVGFMETDMTRGFDMKKVDPREVAAAALLGVEAGREEVLADDSTRELKASLAGGRPLYFDPPALA